VPRDKQPLSVSEVMLRGERLVRLRRAGVHDPHRFVRSDREMDRALLIHSMTEPRNQLVRDDMQEGEN
jgi:hypothetical protein